jgi:hypothetical protein
MTTKHTALRSNWMGHTDAAPKTFRAASNGKIFTRNERLKIIANEHAIAERKAIRLQIILEEKAKIAKEKENRSKVFAGIDAMLETPNAKLKKSKDGFFVQGRNEKGNFLPKVTL